MHPLQIKAALGEAFHTYEAHIASCPDCTPIRGRHCRTGADLAQRVETVRGAPPPGRQPFNSPRHGG